MKWSLFSSIASLMAAACIPASAASYVGYTLSKGTSAAYTIKLHVTLAIPAAYTLIQNAPANIDSLARLALGDMYEFTADVWMFPPTANYFQYPSNPTQRYVSIGAGLIWPHDKLQLDEVRDMVEAIAQGMGIRNAGRLSGNQAREADEDSIMAQDGLVKRDGKCLINNNIHRYTTNDKEQKFNVRGSCIM
ncbi:hypothetical protein QQS21_010389 [Conoideocrella luteorostrata]|uniref:Uncharacterized protein n=1 Tax=Conoideocrella luteorostrata TaxID=1105319 RepID=A0AAJ0FWX2_9HYPO|nr:hypothetical protein QQS21_010389 [Conoideocrella luteorostrata]